MPPVTFKVPVPTGGIRADLPVNEIPANCLYDSLNMIFRNGGFQPRHGNSAFGSNAPGGIVRGVGNVGGTIKLGGGLGVLYFGDTLIAATDSAWKRYAAGSWSTVTSAITAGYHTVFRLFAAGSTLMLIGTNGEGVPGRIDSSGAYAVLGGSPPLAKTMMVLADRLVLLNLSTATGYTGALGSKAFACSAFQDPNSGWSSELNGTIQSVQGDIMAALEMGDLQGMIYTSDAIVAMIAQGASEPFRLEARSIGNVGPANPRCVVRVQDGSHLFLGADGQVYVFDGTQPRPFGNGVQKLVTRTADPDLTYLASMAHGSYNPTLNEATFFFKERGGVTNASVVLSLDNGSMWLQRHLFGPGPGYPDITASEFLLIPGETKRQQAYFYGSTGQGVVESDGDTTDSGNNISVLWTTPLSDLGMPGVWKTLQDVQHLFAWGSPDPGWQAGDLAIGEILIQFTPFGADAGWPTAGSDVYTFVFDKGEYGALVSDHRLTALQHQFQYSQSIDRPFTYNGATVTFAPRGSR